MFSSRSETTHDAATLVAVLRARAAERGAKPALAFLDNGESIGSELSYAELDLVARSIAARLQSRSEVGDRALLLFPPGLEFVCAFLGCLYAGVIAVPAYPPRRSQHLARLGKLIEDAGARLALSTKSLATRLEPTLAASGFQLEWFPFDLEHGDLEHGDLGHGDLGHGDLEQEVSENEASAWTPPAIDGDDLAFLQYTSGSTSLPKGVMVRHRDLLRNESMIQRAFRQNEDSIIVGWLPLYHDMGLIGNVLQPLYLGARSILMSPIAFLQRPLRWLKAISHFQATTSGGPNFGYELCLRKINEEQRQQLDLSSWRVAFNGAEPVSSATIERFARGFADQGFRREAFFPCYGLAEATLFVTGDKRDEDEAKQPAPRILTVERRALEDGRIIPANGNDETAPENQDDGRKTSQRLVGCGFPLDDQRIEIVEPQTRRLLPPGQVGEIWIAGGGVTAGYWRRPDASDEAFSAYLESGEGPFLRTGDLGFLTGGELWVTGRLKELIILRGRNYYPQDLEAVVASSHPELRAGGGAAFSVDIDGEERLVMVQEAAKRKQPNPDEVLAKARQDLAEICDVHLHDLLLIRAGHLPKTSSGKIQRRLCREMWLNDRFEPLAPRRQVSAGASKAVSESERSETLDIRTLRSLEPRERKVLLRRVLRSAIAQLLRLPEDRLPLDRSLAALGLDSLMAIEFKSQIEETLGLELSIAELLAGPTIEQIVERLGSTVLSETDEEIIPFPPANRDASLITQGQRALWFLHQLEPGSAAHHVVGAAEVHGELDVERLRQALRACVERHPALRTTFHESGDHLSQKIHPTLDIDVLEVQEEDTEPSDDGRLDEVWNEHVVKPFDLTRGPLLRLVLRRTSAGNEPAIVLLVMHHIVCDFWSIEILLRELAILYALGHPAVGEPVPGDSNGISLAPAPTVTTADFAAWQERALATKSGERSWDFWHQCLAGERPLLDLPTDRPRSSIRRAAEGRAGQTVSLRLDEAMLAPLEQLARDHETTLSTVVLAAWNVFLRIASGQTDLLVGLPTAGRPLAALADVIGYFVNPVVIRSDLSGDPKIHQVIATVRQRTLDAFAHQDTPFSSITERLDVVREPGISPIYQNQFVYHKARLDEQRGLAGLALGERGFVLDFAGLKLSSLAVARREVEVDLTLTTARLDDGLALSLLYRSALFDATTLERWAQLLGKILRFMGQEPDAEIDSGQFLDPGERQQLLVEWNDDRDLEPAACTLQALFEKQATSTPDALALLVDEEGLTYDDLEQRSRLLALHLLELGVRTGDRVAVRLPRTADLPVALLAVLRAGAAYVPIDPAYPSARQQFMLEDSKASTLVDPEFLDRHRSRKTDPESPLLGSTVSPDDLVCIIYTSGSTGRPKGVMVRHAGVVARMSWAKRCFSPEQLARVLAATSICFDLSIFELFAPLTTGGTAVLAANALALHDLPLTAQVSLINTVPSAMAELLRQAPLPASVSTVNLAGEALERSLVDQLYAQEKVRAVFDLYGPSEDTIYSIGQRVPRVAIGPHAIGRPLPGGLARLVDRRLRLQPLGVVGELLVGGAALARGYLDRPGLTAERFVPDPWIGGGARLYRTGDLARQLPDGEIVFLGRLDHQVKVRGYRIELGEVVAALERATQEGHPLVREATVLVRESQLIAYVVPVSNQTLDIDALKAAVSRELPTFMVPGIFVELDALPRTPNGKLDRRALPHPEATTLEGGRAASTPVEEILLAIWTSVLECEVVDVEASFFALGGHSLLAARVISRLREALDIDLPLNALFEAPTVAALARRIEARHGEHGSEISQQPVSASKDDQAPLSFAQERLWFLEQLGAEGIYNEVLALEVFGPLDVEALERAWHRILTRHEILRSHFEVRDEQPQAVVEPLAPRPLERLAADRSVVDLGRWLAARSFDLEAGEPARLAVFEHDDARHHLFFTAHHIVIDGESWRLLLRELALLYRAEREGSPATLPELAVQYGDYARWQRRAEADETARFRGLVERWREHLGGSAPPVLELPTDRPRPPVQDFAGAELPLSFSTEASDALRQLARSLSLTPFMLFTALFQMLLQRFSGQVQITIGSPISQRPRPEIENLIGLFLNNLVLTTDFAGRPTFHQAINRVRRSILGAFELQDLPFERLVEALEAHRDLSRTPLFQAVFVLHDAELEIPPFPGLDIRHVPLDLGQVKFDLVLDLTDNGEGFRGRLQYRSNLFDRTTIARLARQLERWVSTCLDLPFNELTEVRLNALDVLPLVERHQLVVEWSENTPPAPFPAGESVIDRFLARVRDQPHALAVASASNAWTYTELDQRARRIARRLLDAGLAIEEPAGILIERRPDWVAAILGVMLAGGAYVPMDPALPQERIATLMEDAAMRFVLSDEAALAQMDAVMHRDRRFLAVDALGRQAGSRELETHRSPSAEQLAYLIFTSGSTGRPKGVMIPHRGLANLVDWHVRTYGLKATDRTSLVAGLGFDAAVWEMWPTLACGASLHLVPEGQRTDSEGLVDWLAKTNIDLAFLPTPLAQSALDKPWPTAHQPRALLTGGDRLHGDLAAERPGLVNHYGPTENSVVATAARVFADREPPIGRPIQGSRVHLLDRALRSMPLGASGELTIGGVGLARGYWRRPGQTAERFVPDPLAEEPGARLYRTGDLARWRADGQLLFLGRFDHQVKIRGFRIELGEIEATLRQQGTLESAAVLAFPEQLVAYVVPREGHDVAVDELRRHLGKTLPSYMVPGTFMVLEALPMNANGKLDRAALPEPVASSEFVAPSSALEIEIAEVWQEVLGRKRIGVNEDFFALGGHSLLATRLLARLDEKLGLTLPLRELFTHPTVAELARRVEALRGPSQVEVMQRVPSGEPFVASFAQQRLWFFARLKPESPLYNVPLDLKLSGDLDITALIDGLNLLIERHAALRTTLVWNEERGELLQHLAPIRDWTPEFIDLRNEPNREALAESMAHRLARQPFDLEEGPLWRGVLLRLTADEHRLILVLHHIVCDGWSMEILIRDLAEFYTAQVTGISAEPPPESAIRYVDFARWQRDFLNRETAKGQLDYWREQLKDTFETLDLPLDRPRPLEPDFSGGRRRLHIPAETLTALQRLTLAHGSSLFMLLSTSWAILLHRLSGQRQLTIGYPVANRQRPEVQNLVGFFVNPLPLRIEIAKNFDVTTLLGQVRQRILDGEAHQDLPFERLVDLLPEDRHQAPGSIFQTVVALRDAASEQLEFPGLAVNIAEPETGTAKFDLTLHAVAGDELGGWIEYSTELFDRTSVERLARHFENLLQALTVEGAEAKQLAELPLTSATERHQLLFEHNDSLRVYDREATLHGLFDEQATVAPERVAVATPTEALTYGELRRRSVLVSRALLDRNLEPDSTVALVTERTPARILAILGILRAGAAYLPLNKSEPPKRIESILESSRATLGLWDAGSTDLDLERFGVSPLSLDDLLHNAPRSSSPEPGTGIGGEFGDRLAEGPEVSSTQLAYVMFTSGSTGRPKGVATPHRAVIRLVIGGDFARFDDGQTWLHAAPIAFDASTLEIWGALLHGARLALPQRGLLDPEQLGQDLIEQRISSLWLTEALFHRMVADRFEDLRQVEQLLAGGDALRPADVLAVLAGALAADGKLINGYGPTENTTFTSCHAMSGSGTSPEAVFDGLSSVPIGRPIANTQTYIVDAHGRLAPLGVVGELLAGGDGLARGYFDHPARTAERFVPNPFLGSGERLYRTGDLARRRPGRAIEFLGRLDHQVKVRGFRIEPGEIESALARHPDIADVVVTVHAGALDEKLLVAYTVAYGDEPSPRELRDFAQQHLPAHAIPNHFVPLKALPINVNGKVDRRALPAPTVEPTIGRNFVAPRTEAEEVLAEIWCRVLERERVGVEDDFFELGGHSIAATKVAMEVREAFGVDLELARFFHRSTIAELVEDIEEAILEELENLSNETLEDDLPGQELASASSSEGALG